MCSKQQQNNIRVLSGTATCVLTLHKASITLNTYLFQHLFIRIEWLQCGLHEQRMLTLIPRPTRKIGEKNLVTTICACSIIIRYKGHLRAMTSGTCNCTWLTMAICKTWILPFFTPSCNFEVTWQHSNSIGKQLWSTYLRANMADLWFLASNILWFFFRLWCEDCLASIEQLMEKHWSWKVWVMG